MPLGRRKLWDLHTPSLSPNFASRQAEVVGYSDFKEHAVGKSMGEVKAAGKYRQEGKTYLVKDGDIIHFMFNVTAEKKK